MPLTPQQQDIINYIKPRYSSGEDTMVLVSSVAGSGKTTLLVEIAKMLSHKNGLYLAYNKSISVESQPKFPSTTKCITTHSLAYRNIVAPFGYKVGFFSFREIKDTIPYTKKCELVDNIRSFCLSKFVSYKDFGKSKALTVSEVDLGIKYLGLMEQGTLDCTHEFYLKLFHILLASGDITLPNYDFIMLDEAGDINEVTLEIFRLLPSKLKIAVGDPLQNIYAFNHTVNCFALLKDEGKLFGMSKSFRVNKRIAAKIERFCRYTIDPNMVFEGIDTDTTIVTRGFISRFNSSLIAKMIELNAYGTPYGLVRKAREIFKIPLMLASIKYKGFIPDPGYKHLQLHFNEWEEDTKLRKEFKSPLFYIASLFEDDVQLQGAIRLIAKHGKALLFETYKEAVKHEEAKQNFTLTTAHSSKG